MRQAIDKRNRKEELFEEYMVRQSKVEEERARLLRQQQLKFEMKKHEDSQRLFMEQIRLQQQQIELSLNESKQRQAESRQMMEMMLELLKKHS